MSNTNCPKPNYGIDAPPIIYGLIISAVLIIAISWYGYNNINKYIFTTLIISAIINLVFAILMVYSSKIGKLVMRDFIVAKLNLQGHEQILDVGCGRGLLLIAIAKKLNQNGKSFGIDLWSKKDLSNNNPSYTTQNAIIESVENKIELVTGNMLDMKFSNNQFDCVVSSMAIHNIPSKQQRKQSIKEIVRTLKPGGKLIIQDFQCIDEYRNTLIALGFDSVKISKYYFTMFPPVRILTATLIV